MKSNPNLFLAWLWILLGFGSGLVLGLFFHRENWLGGYGSLKRRMYRLGHISFFGLGTASGAFILGALTMPVCCVVMAHFPKAHLIFAVPVISLITGGILTLLEVAKL